MPQKDRNRYGFTLIELMIVVAIIAIIAAFALPSLLRSRVTSNEASAIASLRAVVSAQQMYKVAEFPNVYGLLTELSNTTPPYIDDTLGDAQYYGDGTTGGDASIKSGYLFEMDRDGGPADADFWCDAYPLSYGKTGVRSFLVTADGVIRFNDTGVEDGVAESWDPPIDG